MSEKNLALGAVFSRHWAIIPDALQNICQIAARENDLEAWKTHLKGGQGEFEAVSKQPGRRLENTYRVTVRQNVAILPLTGPLFPRANLMTNFSGATSLQMFSNDLHTVINDESISAVMLDIDSPGGVVSGPPEMAELLAEAAKTKPVIAYVSGMCASAAYWIASASSEIVAHESALIGSIGVVTARSVQQECNMQGEKWFEIVSSNAENKRPDPSTEEGMSEIKRELDSIENVFLSDVAKYRNVSVEKVKSEFGRGGVLIAADAIKAGMADRSGSFENVLSELANRSTTTQRGGNSMSASNSAEPAATKSGQDDNALTVDSVKANHPEIAKALETAGHEVGHKEGLKAGAKAERERIQSIEAAALPGYDNIVSAAKEDGESTGADVALKIVAAQKKHGGDKMEALEKESEATADLGAGADDLAEEEDSSEGEPKLGPGDEAKGDLEKRAKANWNKDAKIRSEFRNFEAYKGYLKSEEEGRHRIRQSA